jgi:hypothetical protein
LIARIFLIRRSSFAISGSRPNSIQAEVETQYDNAANVTHPMRDRFQFRAYFRGLVGIAGMVGRLASRREST